MPYACHSVYFSFTDHPQSEAKLIYQTWTMEGCESHVEWHEHKGNPGFYWYGLNRPKWGKRIKVAKILAQLPAWEFVRVEQTPVSAQS